MSFIVNRTPDRSYVRCSNMNESEVGIVEKNLREALNSESMRSFNLKSFKIIGLPKDMTSYNILLISVSWIQLNKSKRELSNFESCYESYNDPDAEGNLILMEPLEDLANDPIGPGKHLEAEKKKFHERMMLARERYSTAAKAHKLATELTGLSFVIQRA